MPFVLGVLCQTGLSEIIAGHRYSTGKPSASSVASTRAADLAVQVGKQSTRSRNFLQELLGPKNQKTLQLTGTLCRLRQG